ncbi:dihydrofolate reductase family protein [Allomuricauda taeanensis]|uniref:dihydrofolate reductase family protein n=1 Tax=Flagellimonas taeanensis TaxID=1005926 RepID=UPI002E7B8719|nr:dihydrofolate reductase family protein [Allomuricauda taeanensis]MEE1964240.1 dihydrofolate reductase family protein [Allomuricauda taeanensis]
MEKGWGNRKVILNLAVSLDGYIEGPNGEIDWLTFSEETGKVLHSFLEEIDTILYGRISYEKWGTYTPESDSPDFERSFYKKTGNMSKYVFSSTKNRFDGHPNVVQSEIKRAIGQLKQQEGKDIWLYGGARLITTFFNLDLIDELRLAVSPIILGEGKPLFNGISDRKKLELVKSESHKSGMVSLTYRTIR